MRFKITFIGSGNVATNLAHALDKAGHSINQVISRNVANAKELASKFGAYYGDTPSEMYKDSDFVILCVSDESYYEILEDVPGGMNAIVCHTSGPVSMDILAKYSSNYGVLYPLQSLRKEEVKDILEVPLFIEWSNDSVKSKLHDLADSISNRVREVNSTQRKEYHLAAVFANNFTNAMYTIANDYLVKQGLEFDKLLRVMAGMAIFFACYQAEVIRGGLQAISRGQYEAAEALGLGYWQTMTRIILPQALRICLPGIVNHVIAAFKNTSLVLIIGLFDMLTATTSVMQDPEWRRFTVEAYLAVGFVYFCFCYALSKYSQQVERWLGEGKRF